VFQAAGVAPPPMIDLEAQPPPDPDTGEKPLPKTA
jgi:hypothetical protein